MLNKVILLLFVGFVTSQIVNNVRLVNFQPYFVGVIQDTMNEVERRGWSNLKMADITQNINMTIYGWRVEGTVTYKNGFVISLQKMDLTPSTVQQLWSFNNTDQTGTILQRGTLNLREVAIGFDVEFVQTNGTVDIFTGVFTHELIAFQFSISKNINRDELSVSTSLTSLSAGQRRIVMLPETSVSQVLQRQYTGGLAWDGVLSWRTQAFDPILREVVMRTPFPETCYNCNA